MDRSYLVNYLYFLLSIDPFFLYFLLSFLMNKQLISYNDNFSVFFATHFLSSQYSSEDSLKYSWTMLWVASKNLFFEIFDILILNRKEVLSFWNPNNIHYLNLSGIRRKGAIASNIWSIEISGNNIFLLFLHSNSKWIPFLFLYFFDTKFKD